jgi:hypothetical protein
MSLTAEISVSSMFTRYPFRCFGKVAGLLSFPMPPRKVATLEAPRLELWCDLGSSTQTVMIRSYYVQAGFAGAARVWL